MPPGQMEGEAALPVFVPTLLTLEGAEALATKMATSWLKNDEVYSLLLSVGPLGLPLHRQQWPLPHPPTCACGVQLHCGAGGAARH